MIEPLDLCYDRTSFFEQFHQYIPNPLKSNDIPSVSSNVAGREIPYHGGAGAPVVMGIAGAG